MSEWVKVVYPERRRVRIDTEDLGFTNILLFIGEPGTFWFDLGEPVDYKPKRTQRRVEGTSRRRPLVIDAFEPNGSE